MAPPLIITCSCPWSMILLEMAAQKWWSRWWWAFLFLRTIHPTCQIYIWESCSSRLLSTTWLRFLKGISLLLTPDSLRSSWWSLLLKIAPSLLSSIRTQKGITKQEISIRVCLLLMGSLRFGMWSNSLTMKESKVCKIAKFKVAE